MAQENGHEFLSRLGKTKLRPGGVIATRWLLSKAMITKDMKVLEVACNQAVTTMHIAKEFQCHVTGVDIDSVVIEKARNNVTMEHLENQVNLVVADAFHLPFEDNSFDVILNEAFLTMLVGKRKDEVIKEFVRVLKPGGKLLTHSVCLFTKDISRQKELIAMLSRVAHVHADPLLEEDWTSLFNSNNLSVEHKVGTIEMMNETGMILDEGEENAKFVVQNGMKQENKERFLAMKDFFQQTREDIGYIASVGVLR